jgi:hypothetical protein
MGKLVSISLLVFTFTFNSVALPVCDAATDQDILRLCTIENAIDEGRVDPLDGQVPWPWSNILKFPWSSIEGVWRIVHEGRETYYSFKVDQTDFSNDKVLVIQHFDMETGIILSEGLGFESDDEVIALMTNECGQSYRMSVRAVQGRDSKGRFTTETIMSLGSVDALEDWYFHFIMKKMGEEPIDSASPTSCSQR